MSLLTTWSATNRVVTSGLNIKYRADNKMWDGGAASGVEPTYWYSELYRYCTKSYEYIGMTKATAESCLTAMREKYTRSYANWSAVSKGSGTTTAPDIFVSNEYNFFCASSIEMQQEEGDAWKVVIQVNETDKTIAREPQTTVAALDNLFKFAKIRDYDEDSPVLGVAILKAKYEPYGVVIDYDEIITGFDLSKLKIQRFLSNASGWTDVNTLRSTSNRIIGEYYQNGKFRLNYDSGEYLSQEVTTYDDTVTSSIDVHLSSAGGSLATVKNTVADGDVGFSFSWGDGTALIPLITSSPQAHTFAEYYQGPIVSVNGAIKSISGSQSQNVPWLSGYFETAVVYVRNIKTIGEYAFNGVGPYARIHLEGVSEIYDNAFGSGVSELTVDMTKDEIGDMEGYPFGLTTGAVIHATDGDINI